MTENRHEKTIGAMNSKHSEEFEWAADAVRFWLVRWLLECGFEEAAQERAGR